MSRLNTYVAGSQDIGETDAQEIPEKGEYEDSVSASASDSASGIGKDLLYDENKVALLGYMVKTNEDGSKTFENIAKGNEKDEDRKTYLKTQINLINDKALDEVIKSKISDIKTTAQKAIAAVKDKGIELKDGETDLQLTGGKRTRRRRSKTRNRRTKNNRKKQYKR
jgi:hypothetical protein